MTLIDLGSTGTEAPVPRDLLFDRRLARRLVAALMTLLCLAALGASNRPEPRGLHLVWSVDQVSEGGFAVTGDSLIVSSGDNGSAGPQGDTLTSYALADGRKRWSRALNGQAPWFQVGPDDRVLLLATGERIVPSGGTSVNYFTRTMAVDVATGRELWQAEGTGTGWAATGTALLEDRGKDGVSTSRLRVVRLSDGGKVWSRETPGVRSWATLGTEADDPDQVATVDSAGDVRVLSLADGAETARGTVQWDPGTPSRGDYIRLIARGDDIYVLKSSAGQSTATAYSARTLRTVWSVTQRSGGTVPYPCGVVLCMTDSDGLLGYDWADGHVTWRTPGLLYGTSAGHGLLAADNNSETHRVLLDQATGRQVAELGTGKPATGEGGRMVFVTDFSRSPTGRTVVRQIDPRTGETLTIGTMGPIADWGCSAAGRLLLCNTLQGALTITDVG